MPAGSISWDDGQAWRAEIEQRTRDGESCAAIAAALQAQGVSVSSKTISRKRVEWGFRRRAENSTKGRKLPPSSKRLVAAAAAAAAAAARKSDEGRIVGKKQAGGRKAEIVERTRRGETAEQICEHLRANGVEIKKGAATITRLQTFWGLIPYDPDRAFGRGRYKKTHPRLAKGENARRELGGLNRHDQNSFESNSAPASRPLHSHSNLTFNQAYPHRRNDSRSSAQGRRTEVNAREVDEDVDSDSDADGNVYDEAANDDVGGPSDAVTVQTNMDNGEGALIPPLPPQEPSDPRDAVRTTRRSRTQRPDQPLRYFPSQSTRSNRNPPALASSARPRDPVTTDSDVDIAAELVSAEVLVNLATTALTAATTVRNLLLNSQFLTMTSDSATWHNVAATKGRLREAAGMLYDLAGDTTLGKS